MESPPINNKLFSIRDTDPKSNNTTIESEKITYQDYGFQQAGRLGGTIPGLRVCLQKIFFDFKQETKDNYTKQEELKKPFIVKIEQYKGDNERLGKRIEKVKTEDIPNAKQKVERLKEELSHIRKNPHEITGDNAGRASFLVGGVILLFLTVYLFIFYSSATYSTFFKEFTINEIGVVNSIFDANALSKALHDGITELVLILTIPFVFLGLGYLIHKFEKEKGFGKYLKVVLLIFITFIFDSILAYEITEKIYNIQKANSFYNVPDYTISTSLQSVNFWLIIFAGFIVYIIWGFVFNFIMDAYGKMDKVKIANQEKEQEIKGAEADLKNLEMEIDKIRHTVDENSTEINKLNRILNNPIIPREFEQDIFSFSLGWMAWMRQSGKSSHAELSEADSITHEFVKTTLYNFEIINT